MNTHQDIARKYNQLRDMADARRESVGNHRYYRMVRACDLWWNRATNRLITEEINEREYPADDREREHLMSEAYGNDDNSMPPDDITDYE